MPINPKPARLWNVRIWRNFSGVSPWRKHNRLVKKRRRRRGCYFASGEGVIGSECKSGVCGRRVASFVHQQNRSFNVLRMEASPRMMREMVKPSLPGLLKSGLR